MSFSPTRMQCWKCSAASTRTDPHRRARSVAATVKRCSTSSAARARSAAPSWKSARIRPRPTSAAHIPSCHTSRCRGLMRPRTNRGLRFIRCEPWNCVLPTQADLIRAPIRRHPVVVVNLDFAAAVAPVKVLPGAKRRRALQFLLGEIEMIGAERAIVSQARPGNRDMLLSHAEETPEAEHRVSNVSAELIDHEALDGADLAAIGTPDRGAFDPVAGNQAMGLASRRVGLHGCLH